MGWFGLAELLILALLTDGLFRRLGLPGLIGMLLVGIALGQSGLGLSRVKPLGRLASIKLAG
ncbi:hypothetical protein [Synechococcus sp. 8F6]|uniref:hypothetical protein n=1 Tax=Synechococcus sp. 8F6 TaxID=2025606 RepID=UPI000B9836E5|nr:hypothetical protein [Synechococcus sp. 8F6]